VIDSGEFRKSAASAQRGERRTRTIWSRSRVLPESRLPRPNLERPMRLAGGGDGSPRRPSTDDPPPTLVVPRCHGRRRWLEMADRAGSTGPRDQARARGTGDLPDACLRRRFVTVCQVRGAVHDGVIPGGWPGWRGRLRSVAVPSGTVTFLFTDIEGSTRLWQQDEPAMRAALSRHDELLRSAVAEHGGTVFSSMGDGIAAAFLSASSARPRRQRRRRPRAPPARHRQACRSGCGQQPREPTASCRLRRPR